MHEMYCIKMFLVYYYYTKQNRHQTTVAVVLPARARSARRCRYR